MSGQAQITITYHGLTRSIRQWSDLLGLNYYSLAARVRRGWSAERALETPVRHRGTGPKTHGATGTREYVRWKSMIYRCSSTRYHAAHRYIGRGLTVCARWRHSFSAFLADVGPCPSPDLSLGRVNNDLGYMPGNCRWENARQQAQNRSRPSRRSKT